MSLATTISTTTATGATTPTTDTSGSPTTSMKAGLLITKDTGIGSRLGDGLGSTTLLGATLRSTTAVGLASADAGDGWRVPWQCTLSMLLHWWFSSAEAPAASAAT